jgi:hypothetical protein
MPKPEERSSAQQGIVKTKRGRSNPPTKRALSTSVGRAETTTPRRSGAAIVAGASLAARPHETVR